MKLGGMNPYCIETAGSTAVVVLVSDEYVYVANLGDSKAIVLGKNGEILL